MAKETYRALETFFVPDPNGLAPRRIEKDVWFPADDPVLKNRGNREKFQSMTEYVEQATHRPGERRAVHIPDEVRNPKENTMPHHLPPEHEDSPASPFAPGQPAAGVVADDVPPEQNPAGGPKAADAPTIVNTPPEPQTAQQAANAEAQKAANEKALAAKSTKGK